MAISGILYLLLSGNAPLNLIASTMVQGMNNFTLLAIPFFILVGELMNVTGMTKKMINFIQYFQGSKKGGLAYAAITINVILACVSGSAPADCSAVSSVLIPSMREEKYKDDFAAAVNCCAAVIGPIIPPSIPMVVLATLVNVSIGKLFVGGVIPGLLLAGCMYVVAWLKIRKMDLPVNPDAYKGQSLGKIFSEAVLGLLAPIIIIVGVLSGIATVTEVSILACFYVMVVGFLVYRNLTLKILLEALRKATIFASSIMALFGIVGIFTWFVAVEKIAVNLSAAVAAMNLSPLIFLLIVNIFLLFIGMIMDAVPAMTVFMPVMMPIAISLGIDPIHFGIVVVVNLMLGLVTPPVGALLYVEQKISGVPFNLLVKEVVPFVAAMIVMLFVITYVPQTVTFLPNLLLGGTVA